MYLRMTTCLNVISVNWQFYINAIISSIQDKPTCLSIMDGLLMLSSKQSYTKFLEIFLKILFKNGLQKSPRKYQFFSTKLQYTSNTILIKDKRIYLKPLKNSIDASQILKTPKTAEQCTSFAGVKIYLNMFCPSLQKMLKPINDFTRKGRPFLLTKINQGVFH